MVKLIRVIHGSTWITFYQALPNTYLGVLGQIFYFQTDCIISACLFNRELCFTYDKTVLTIRLSVTIAHLTNVSESFQL